MKQFTTLLFSVALFSLNFAIAQQPAATQAPAIKTFALQPDLMGAASNSVNLFTGDVALPLTLLSLSGRGGLDANVTISYNSNVQGSVGVWNLEAPTGILGLGWSMDIPKIVVDHKGTGAKDDDAYYLLQGGASNRLVRTTSGSDANGAFKIYQAKSYKFWKIKFYTGIQKWEITDENGSRFIYGDANSARGTIQYIVNWDNWIGNSAQTSGQTQMPISWSLSEIINRWNEKITFEYDNVEQYVGSSAGRKHTEASYLKQITDVLGRKIKFYYNLKDDTYFIEPHTERPTEPDAYQEVYEKKYLDHIDVETDNGNKFTSVHFGYGNIDAPGNTAKMLLTSIVQKNASGQQLPGLQFLYNTAGGTKGMLNKITYPTGGTVTYTYSAKSVSRGNRTLTVPQPAAGYAEPKVWIAEDYVVVGWRQLSSGGGHTSSGRNVKLYVYQWLGGWKEKFLADIPDVSLDGESNVLDWEKFQVSVESNFFAVIHANNGSSNYLVRLYSKSESTRGDWSNYVSTATNYGDIYDERRLTLVTGENFVIVGADAQRGSSTHATVRWISTKDGWRRTTVDEADGTRHYYTGAGNYFITHNTGVFLFAPLTSPTFKFTHLTEDRKWVETPLSSPVPFTGYGKSYWHPSSTFVVSMADDNDERIYRWNSTYTTFYRDLKDVNNNDLFGSRADEAQVNVVANNLAAINDEKSYFARFDGKYWYKSSFQPADNFYYFFPSYGEDVVVGAVSDAILSGYFYYDGIRREFDPNQLAWKTDFPMTGADRGQNAFVGNDFYSYGNNYYYRQPSGSWTKYPVTVNNASLDGPVGYPQFAVWHEYTPDFTLVDIKKFKNGALLQPFYKSGSVLMNTRRFKNYGIGFETIVTCPTSTDLALSTSITLTRFIKDNINGTLTDYPVTLITINDGSANQYTSLDYNASTAVLDASGNTAQYNEVTVMPGCNACQVTSPTKPYGSTKTFFYNGLSSAELGVAYMPVDLRWTGFPYKVDTYNATGMLVASAVTSYSTFTKTLNNDAGELIELAAFVRPTEVNSTEYISAQDAITTRSVDNYNENTGLIESRQTFDYDSKGGTTDQILTRYKYFWEQYDPTRQLNILTPVIQTKESIRKGGTETILTVSATTWKTWGTVWGPHKTYQWKRSGASDFNFTSWNGTGEPAGDWLKLSQVDNVDNIGNVLQVSK